MGASSSASSSKICPESPLNRKAYSIIVSIINITNHRKSGNAVSHRNDRSHSISSTNTSKK